MSYPRNAEIERLFLNNNNNINIIRRVSIRRQFIRLPVWNSARLTRLDMSIFFKFRMARRE